jgi:AraC-like DNA-binding protein
MDSGCGFEIVHIDGNSIKECNIFINTFSIFKCTSGSATIEKNGVAYHFCSGTHFCLYETAHLRIIQFSDDFSYVACNIDISFTTELYPYLDNKIWSMLDHSNPEVVRLKEFQMLDVIFGQLNIIFNVDNFQFKRQIALHTMINYILVMYNILKLHINIADIQGEGTSTLNNSMLDRFYLLCNEHHTKERNIAFYSQKLHISKRHLYNIVNSSIQCSPKQLLDNFIVGTIKKLLLTTSLSIQQISEMLNFPDQSTLRQFFKRNMGMSPLEYRQKNKQ